MGSVEDREKLKEEYKEHYRAIKDLRKKAAESERMAKIARTLEDMNADHLLDAADAALHRVREKIELAEAKLDMIIHHRDSAVKAADEQDLDEVLRKQKAAETIRNIREEMGTAAKQNTDTVTQAPSTEKSLGPVTDTSGHTKLTAKDTTIQKTLGPRKFRP